MTEASVQCVDLTMKFGEHVVLEDISLEVHKGESLAILGHNGAGKSTLLRAICGLMHPDEGSCRIEGYRVDKKRARLSTLIGYMPDKDILYHERSVLQNLLFHAAIRNSSGEVLSQRTSSALVDTNTSNIRDARVSELSAGRLKKAQLACAIVHRPRILLLDEPCAGLDWAARTRLWKIVRNFKENLAAIIVATEEVREASECGRILILVAGRIVAEGTKDSLTPCNEYELPAVVKVPCGQKNLVRVLAHPDVLATFDSPPHTRIVFRDKPTARRVMQESEMSPTDFSIARASLEESYVGLTASCQGGFGFRENPRKC